MYNLKDLREFDKDIFNKIYKVLRFSINNNKVNIEVINYYKKSNISFEVDNEIMINPDTYICILNDLLFISRNKIDFYLLISLKHETLIHN